MKRIWLPAALEAVLVLCLVLTGFGLRRLTYEGERSEHGLDLPFTRESALAFRRVRMAAEAGRLPRHDPGVMHPEGIDPYQTYEISREWVYPALLRLTPRGWPLAERVRWLEVAWFSLGIAAMYAWLRLHTGSRWAGTVAAGLWACSFGAVVRSTGLELSGDTFALPLVLGHFALDAAAGRAGSGRTRVGWAVASALALAAAACSWDLVQVVILLRALVFIVHHIARGRPEPGWGWRWGLPSVAVLLAAVLNPYLRHQHALASPGYLLTLAGLLAAALPLHAGARDRWVRLGTVAVVVGVGLGLGAMYRDHYGHFRELMVAVIRFRNQKPEDPSLLTYEQRILWVPPLNPPTLLLTRAFFPSLWFVLPALALAGLRNPGRRVRIAVWVWIALVFVSPYLVGLAGGAESPNPWLTRTLTFLMVGVLPALALVGAVRLGASLRIVAWGWIVAVLAYGLFVKFHLFAALFAAPLAGLAAARGLSGPRRRGIVEITVLLALSLTWESLNTVARAQGTISRAVEYADLKELVGWFGPDLPPAPVVANFPVSGPLLAYADTPIVLHPKFEQRGIRDRVRAYGEALFKGTEETFRDWVDDHEAVYYVHGIGEFASWGIPGQMRYMVDAVDAGPETAARILEQAAQEGRDTRYFRFERGNRKYAVFSMLTRADQRRAETWMVTARDNLARGEWRMAELAAERALALDPHTPGAMDLLATVDRIRRRQEPGGDRP